MEMQRHCYYLVIVDFITLSLSLSLSLFQETIELASSVLQDAVSLLNKLVKYYLSQFLYMS